MNDIQYRKLQRELDAYAAENNLPPITVEQWQRIAQEQLDAAVEAGVIEVVGLDEFGDPVYQGVTR